MNQAMIEFLGAKTSLNMKYLSANPAMASLLVANPHMIDWIKFSLNPSPIAIEFLKVNLDKINWYNLSQNPSAIEILMANPDKINWNILSRNPSAMNLLIANKDKINWEYLASNTNIIAIEMLVNEINSDEDFKEEYEEIFIECFLQNPTIINLIIHHFNDPSVNKIMQYCMSIEYLEAEIYQIYLIKSSLNPNSAIMKLLTENLYDLMGIHWVCCNISESIFDDDGILDWDELSENPCAAELLATNPERISWDRIQRNPNIHLVLEYIMNGMNSKKRGSDNIEPSDRSNKRMRM